MSTPIYSSTPSARTRRKRYERARSRTWLARKGDENIVIPDATYLTESKDAKVSYDSIELAPIGIAYESEVYDMTTNSATISGLKFGVKKK